MDFRIKSPCSILLAGASKSGKTSLAFKMIQNRDSLFTNPENQGKIYVFYTEFQPLFNTFSHIVDEFIEGACSMEWLRENSDPNGKTITVILDDLALNKSAMAQASSIFAIGSHHLNANVLFLTQNLFSKDRHARDLSLNASYIIVFRNPRDKSQVSHFAKQFFPSNPRVITQIFEIATTDPYSYLMFDMNQMTNEKYRMLSHLFSEDLKPPRVYVINNY